MNNKRILYIVLTLVGLTLVLIGGFVLDSVAAKVVSGIVIGGGAGLAGLSISQIITDIIIAGNPEHKQQIDIEANDERNIQINLMAKAKAFDFSVYLPLPIFLLLILAGTAREIILLLVAVYVLNWSIYLWYLNKFIKKM